MAQLRLWLKQNLKKCLTSCLFIACFLILFLLILLPVNLSLKRDGALTKQCDYFTPRCTFLKPDPPNCLTCQSPPGILLL